MEDVYHEKGNCGGAPGLGGVARSVFGDTDARRQAKTTSALRTASDTPMRPMVELAERLIMLGDRMRREMGGMAEVLEDHSDRVHGGRPVGDREAAPHPQSHEYDGALGQVWAALDSIEATFDACSNSLSNAVSRATTLA